MTKQGIERWQRGGIAAIERFGCVIHQPVVKKHHVIERRVRAVVHVGRSVAQIAQRGRAEGLALASGIRQAECMHFEIAQHWAVMAKRAASALKRLQTSLLKRGKRFRIAAHETIKR